MASKPNIIISEQDLHRLETMLEHQSKLTVTMQHLEEFGTGRSGCLSRYAA